MSTDYYIYMDLEHFSVDVIPNTISKVIIIEGRFVLSTFLCFKVHRWLAPSTKRTAPKPGFELRPQRFFKLSTQMHHH